MSLRKKPTPPAILRARQVWGQHLQDHLDHVRMSRYTLAALIGFKTPTSVNQIVSGQQGISLEVMHVILRIFPSMLEHYYPRPRKKERGRGALGPHKKHDYPLGSQRRKPIRGRRPPKY